MFPVDREHQAVGFFWNFMLSIVIIFVKVDYTTHKKSSNNTDGALIFSLYIVKLSICEGCL